MQVRQPLVLLRPRVDMEVTALYCQSVGQSSANALTFVADFKPNVYNPAAISTH